MRTIEDLTPAQQERFWHNFAVNTGDRFPALREQFPAQYPTQKVDIDTGDPVPSVPTTLDGITDEDDSITDATGRTAYYPPF